MLSPFIREHEITEKCMSAPMNWIGGKRSRIDRKEYTVFQPTDTEEEVFNQIRKHIAPHKSVPMPKSINTPIKESLDTLMLSCFSPKVEYHAESEEELTIWPPLQKEENESIDFSSFVSVHETELQLSQGKECNQRDEIESECCKQCVSNQAEINKLKKAMKKILQLLKSIH